MNRIFAAVAFAAVSLPAIAAACSPAYQHETAITASDAPECLRVEGLFTDYDVDQPQIVAINECDVPVELSCPSDEGQCFREGGDFTLQPGERQVLSFYAFTGRSMAWSTEDGTGTIEYEIVDTYTDGCNFGCQAGPGERPTGWLPTGFGLGFLGLVALRRLR